MFAKFSKCDFACGSLVCVIPGEERQVNFSKVEGMWPTLNLENLFIRDFSKISSD